MIETLAWVLPRPGRDHYPGGYPLWFEERLFNLYGWPSNILHLFGGKAKYGIRLDVKSEVAPDVIGDSHYLPFKGDVFDMVVADPPYSNDYSKEMYGTGKLVYKKWVAEAVRVCKPGGFVVVYHLKWVPRPEGTVSHRRIFLAVRVWHHLRYVGIYQKGG